MHRFFVHYLCLDNEYFPFQTFKELKCEVPSYKSKKPQLVTEPKILMVGPVGSGKSSFISSINKIYNGQSSQLAHVEEGDAFSVTRQVSLFFII